MLLHEPVDDRERAHGPDLERGHGLDNPVFTTLATSHRAVARVHGSARRFPDDIAPFVAVEHSLVPLPDVVPLCDVGERVFFVGPAPRFDDDWELCSRHVVHQFRSHLDLAALAATDPDPLVLELGEDDRPDMLALAEEVYPFFFRERTATLGIYFGVRHQGRLVAMGGERMRVPGHQEVSTVCTLPEFARAGYASRIGFRLLRHAALRGDRVFFHCVEGNDPVFSLLRKLGGAPWVEMPMVGVRRLR
ncbi:GNAT family N-acetyltransferase [Paraliomyxa miuraensis]|uniref:GNAT family N-acetyltransferase n=1 Tax=Paraliomyxa miuraensis TaxID=376150 RepID=UPI002255F2E0|nr:GNAT family N-acetyltransferase [Paraliomyxa miuraensis]MCX4244099.1 GNAT family N-acetyltransferase [Paraliomyxa miuraensis]